MVWSGWKFLYSLNWENYIVSKKVVCIKRSLIVIINTEIIFVLSHIDLSYLIVFIFRNQLFRHWPRVWNSPVLKEEWVIHSRRPCALLKYQLLPQKTNSHFSRYFLHSRCFIAFATKVLWKENFTSLRLKTDLFWHFFIGSVSIFILYYTIFVPFGVAFLFCICAFVHLFNLFL